MLDTLAFEPFGSRKKKDWTGNISTTELGALLDVDAGHTRKARGFTAHEHLLRQDVASRWTAFHEWLHRALQRRTGVPRPGEDDFIEAFLERHKAFFRLEE